MDNKLIFMDTIRGKAARCQIIFRLFIKHFDADRNNKEAAPCIGGIPEIKHQNFPLKYDTNTKGDREKVSRC
jgi:hypothetical protein